MNSLHKDFSVLCLVFTLSVCFANPTNYYPYYSYYKDKGTETTCNAVADIVILYDASGSIVTDSNNVFGDPQQNFQLMKDFMAAVVDEFNPVGPTGAQFAALCFSTEVVDHFYLNKHGTAQEVKDAIAAFVTSPNQRTSIGKGLVRARDEYFLPANGGKRDCAKEFIILLTDGVHNEGDPFPVPVAQELKDAGVVIITVGIGNGTNEQELTDIASPGFKFDVENFSELADEIDAIVQSACEATECTSETGGENQGGDNHGGRKYKSVKDGQIISISVPVNVFLPPPQWTHGGGRQSSYGRKSFLPPPFGHYPKGQPPIPPTYSGIPQPSPSPYYSK